MKSLGSATSTRGVTRTHRDLVAWKESMRLLAATYRLAAQLPSVERYGLASQLRRAAVSIPANIAEGFGRRGTGEMRHFLSIAEGSLRELQTLLDAIVVLEYMPPEAVQPASDASNRVGYLVHRFRQSLTRNAGQPRQRGPP
ncbi:MAG TPA: four helix bundle protein [Gemmatimonadaceae bacterium]|nr:four helix bundle protein [Gemmatimonadaceae bacterium]